MTPAPPRKRDRTSVAIASAGEADFEGNVDGGVKRPRTTAPEKQLRRPAVDARMLSQRGAARRVTSQAQSQAKVPSQSRMQPAQKKRTTRSSSAQIGELELTGSGGGSTSSTSYYTSEQSRPHSDSKPQRQPSAPPPPPPPPAISARSPPAKQTRLRPTTVARSNAARTTSAKSTPSPSPGRARHVSKKSESPSQSIHSFFQRTSASAAPSPRKPEEQGGFAGSQNTVQTIDEVDEIQDDDDEIEDFLADDDELEDLLREEAERIERAGEEGKRRETSTRTTTTTTTTAAAARTQRSSTSRPAPNKLSLAPTTTKPATRAAKRFILPPSPTATAKPPSQTPSYTVHPTSSASASAHDLPHRPWADRFPPLTMDELAVHKRKVADVQRWLSDAFTGRSRQRILVLRGPAGSGKTTTVGLLARVLGYEVVEWRQPLGGELSVGGEGSLSATFDEFLDRGEQYGQLAMEGGEGGTVGRKEGAVGGAGSARRIILIEEFPGFLGQASAGLNAFRGSLYKYLAQATRLADASALAGCPPIVMIVSEALLGSARGPFDAFTAHRLLGAELAGHPGIGFVDFNPVAPTFMAKALQLVLRKEARQSGRKRVPSPAVLKQFYELGDIRSAISAVEFLCRGDKGVDSGGSLSTGRTRKSSTREPPETAETASLQMVTQREASLGLFHATGKVIHNKRDNPKDLPPNSERLLPPPPPHLQQTHARPLASQVAVDTLIDETGTDASTFLASLHENFPLSCSGPAFPTHFDDCIAHLSDADLLGSDSHRNIRSGRLGLGSARAPLQGYGGGMDVLRQDEISFQAAVRGLLFSLPYPVKRAAGAAGSRTRGFGDAHKMYYPTSLQLWRRTEELEALLDGWLHRLTDPLAADASAKTHARTGTVETWKSINSNPKSESRGASDRVLLTRDDVLLDRLPYLRRISRNTAERQDLEKLTQFQGIGSRWARLAEEEAEQPGDEVAEEQNAAPPTELGDDAMLLAGGGKQGAATGTGTGTLGRNDGGGALELAAETEVKLVLSDDDIEDGDD